MIKNISFVLCFIFLLNLYCQSVQQNTSNQKISDTDVNQSESVKYKEFAFSEIMEKLKTDPEKILKNKYRAEYYPVRIFHKIPYKIKNQVKGNEKIVMLTPKNGKYHLFMLFPEDMIEEFQFYTRKHKKIRFICQPLQLFNKRSPLIRLNSIVAVN